jgi:hypothetical protein
MVMQNKIKQLLLKADLAVKLAKKENPFHSENELIEIAVQMMGSLILQDRPDSPTEGFSENVCKTCNDTGVTGTIMTLRCPDC